jgi:hypothetical protein
LDFSKLSQLNRAINQRPLPQPNIKVGNVVFDEKDEKRIVSGLHLDTNNYAVTKLYAQISYFVDGYYDVESGGTYYELEEQLL